MSASERLSSERTERKSIFRLIGDLPGLVGELIRGEIESIKKEIISKLISVGVGVGLLVVAIGFLFFMLASLVAAAILGIATALPAWAAALIVAGGLLILGGIIGLIGVGQLKRGVPPAPTESIESIKKDVNVIKGTGKRD
jgi:hypothetical protein